MAEKITVDTVIDDPSTGELVLYFIEDGPWPQDAGRFGRVLASEFLAAAQIRAKLRPGEHLLLIPKPS